MPMDELCAECLRRDQWAYSFQWLMTPPSAAIP
jgi:hypothetical protein